jgi:hypothetical protein
LANHAQEIPLIDVRCIGSEDLTDNGRMKAIAMLSGYESQMEIQTKQYSVTAKQISGSIPMPFSPVAFGTGQKDFLSRPFCVRTSPQYFLSLGRKRFYRRADIMDRSV